MKKCRRCADCEGMEHHWIDNDEAETERAPSFVCKHCPAVGEYHSIVEGVDEVDEEDDVIVQVARSGSEGT